MVEELCLVGCPESQDCRCQRAMLCVGGIVNIVNAEVGACLCN